MRGVFFFSEDARRVEASSFKKNRLAWSLGDRHVASSWITSYLVALMSRYKRREISPPHHAVTAAFAAGATFSASSAPAAFSSPRFPPFPTENAPGLMATVLVVLFVL